MAPIALDVHAHLAPVIADELRHIDGVSWQPEKPCLVIDGHSLNVADLFYPERLIRWMDEHEVERAFISVPPPLYRQHLSAEAAAVWVRYLNTGLLEIAGAYADRLDALLHLPLEHPALACVLAEDLGQRHSAGAALAAGGMPEILFSNPDYDPLWTVLDSQKSFVFLHPGHCCDGRLAPFYLDNLLGNPYETAVAASHLILAGVPERFPRIRFCLAHAGGCLPSVGGRLQRGFDTRRPGLDVSLEPPVVALRRFYADCIAHSPDALALAAGVFGEDHILFGSDWPFPMGIPSPQSTKS